jgi:chromosome segregation ATPase
MLLEDIEDARDLLGLDDNEPGNEIVEAADQASIDRERHAIDLEKVRAETTSRVSQRDTEIQRLRSQIDAMQETLAKRENPADEPKHAPREKSAAPDPSEQNLAETRELRDQLRRLKDNLKVEHEERNRALRDLRTARDQLRRSTREKSETPSMETAAGTPSEDDESTGVDIEWERQPLRIPDFTAAFRESLRKHPRQASAAALTAAGRLAAGDPSIWKTVRALKLRPGTLRVRIGGDYRLLFESGPADTLRLVDLILRRDLDRWLAGGGR